MGSVRWTRYWRAFSPPSPPPSESGLGCVHAAQAMNALLARLFAICRLRLGPQDLPYAPATAQALIVTVLLLEMALSQLLAVPDRLLLPSTVCSAVLLIWERGGGGK